MKAQSDNPKGRRDDEIVVFWVVRPTRCSECDAELDKGRLLRLEQEKALCMECADLDHLEFLPRGDTAVTRRASKYSKLRAVVVRWSRTRKRYERQGILAEPGAIARAEEESLAGAEVRARRQVRAAERRTVEDEEFVAAFAPRHPRAISRLPGRRGDRHRPTRVPQVQRSCRPHGRRQAGRPEGHPPGRNRPRQARPHQLRRPAGRIRRPPIGTGERASPGVGHPRRPAVAGPLRPALFADDDARLGLDSAPVCLSMRFGLRGVFPQTRAGSYDKAVLDSVHLNPMRDS